MQIDVKWKLFMLTLIEPARASIKSLPDKSIDLSSKVCKTFPTHFIDRKRQHKYYGHPQWFDSRKKKKLCAYIDRFTKVAVVVGGMNEILKCWIMEKRLRVNNSLWESPGLKQAHKRKDLLSKAHPYISYEETILSNGGNRGLENPELSWNIK